MHSIFRRFFGSIPLLIAPLLLTACVDLSGTGLSAEKKSSIGKRLLEQDGEVHTMRGGLGIFSIGMNQLQTTVTKRFNIPASSSMWYNAGNVSRSIITYHYTHKSHRPVILVGHSLGANEQIKVARNLGKVGIPVALLVTVDAVSPTYVPSNVQYVLNIYKPGYVPMFSGRILHADNPGKTHIENLNVNTLKGMQVNHFTLDKDKQVQARILNRIDKVLKDAKRKDT